MGLTKQIKTTLGILASVLVVAMPASAATTIQVVRDVSSRDAALPTGATANHRGCARRSARDAAIRAGDADPGGSRRPARDARAVSGEAAIAYFRWRSGCAT